MVIVIFKRNRSGKRRFYLITRDNERVWRTGASGFHRVCNSGGNCLVIFVAVVTKFKAIFINTGALGKLRQTLHIGEAEIILTVSRLYRFFTKDEVGKFPKRFIATKLGDAFACRGNLWRVWMKLFEGKVAVYPCDFASRSVLFYRALHSGVELTAEWTFVI